MKTTCLEPANSQTLQPPGLDRRKKATSRKERDQRSRKPKTAEVEAKVERQRGWDRRVAGARLGSFCTKAPSMRHPEG